MGAEDSQYTLPAELDTYMQESIFHMLGFCPSEDQLQQKLSKAEESYRDLALQMHHVQLRLRELEHKRSKSKEEAVMNAQALKRQVAEGQKLTEQCRLLQEECNRLEQECKLYNNDRDVFMDAAYEAEDRAAEAEDRAAEAERKTETLVAKLESIQQELAQSDRNGLEMDHADYVESLKCQITKLEVQNRSLQEEISLVRLEKKQNLSAICSEAICVTGEEELRVLLSAANERYEKTSTDLCTLRETHAQELAAREDEQEVHRVVSAAVTAGVCKAMDEERAASLNALNLEFSSIFARMESELGRTRERLEIAEMHVQVLLSEVQELRQESGICKGNLDKAEVEVQMLGDENKELRILLRRRYTGSDSHMQNKGNKGGRSQSGGRSRSKSYEGHGEDNNARQSLMPLPANTVERKSSRRQNLAVDGSFCSTSPRLCLLNKSPGSLFQDSSIINTAEDCCVVVG